MSCRPQSSLSSYAYGNKIHLSVFFRILVTKIAPPAPPTQIFGGHAACGAPCDPESVVMNTGDWVSHCRS